MHQVSKRAGLLEIWRLLEGESTRNVLCNVSCRWWSKLRLHNGKTFVEVEDLPAAKSQLKHQGYSVRRVSRIPYGPDHQDRSLSRVVIVTVGGLAMSDIDAATDAAIVRTVSLLAGHQVAKSLWIPGKYLQLLCEFEDVAAAQSTVQKMLVDAAPVPGVRGAVLHALQCSPKECLHESEKRVRLHTLKTMRSPGHAVSHYIHNPYGYESNRLYTPPSSVAGDDTDSDSPCDFPHSLSLEL